MVELVDLVITPLYLLGDALKSLCENCVGIHITCHELHAFHLVLGKVELNPVVVCKVVFKIHHVFEIGLVLHPCNSYLVDDGARD